MNNAHLHRHQSAWSVAADLLNRERVEGLQSMTDEDTRRAVVRLFSLRVADVTGAGDAMTGLVEQQRLFRRLGKCLSAGCSLVRLRCRRTSPPMASASASSAALCRHAGANPGLPRIST